MGGLSNLRIPFPWSKANSTSTMEKQNELSSATTPDNRSTAGPEMTTISLDNSNPAIVQTEEEDDEDNYEYPKKWKLALITIALCLSVFCMALDNTIIATAIPRITDQFHALNEYEDLH